MVYRKQIHINLFLIGDGCFDDDNARMVLIQTQLFVDDSIRAREHF